MEISESNFMKALMWHLISVVLSFTILGLAALAYSRFGVDYFDVSFGTALAILMVDGLQMLWHLFIKKGQSQ